MYQQAGRQGPFVSGLLSFSKAGADRISLSGHDCLNFSKISINSFDFFNGRFHAPLPISVRSLQSTRPETVLVLHY